MNSLNSEISSSNPTVRHSTTKTLHSMQNAQAEFGAAARCLQALGHPLSLRILFLLADGEASVGQVQMHLRRPLPSISLYLHRLADRGILRCRSVGTRSYYALRNTEVAALVASLRLNYLN